MSEDFIQDALNDREEWLSAMDATEEMVHEDPMNELEFIFIQAEGGDALTRVWLPFTIQSKTIHSSHVINVKKTT